MPADALPCIVCSKTLKNYATDGGNQPSGGTEFLTHGHYGSTAFDPMDGHLLVVNVCDECLTRAGTEGKVLLGRDSKPVVACGIGPTDLQHMPVLIGQVPVKRELVPWHDGLENEGEEDRIVLDPDDIGSPLYPEVKYYPGVLEEYGPKDEGPDAS